MIQDFIAQFTQKNIRFIQIRDRYFLEQKSLEQFRLSSREKVFGLYLGEEKDGEFIPSFPLLDIIAPLTEDIVVVKDMGEIDFLYGNNLRARHIISVSGSLEKGTMKLVQNLFGETIGYGELVGSLDKKGMVIKHFADRGVFIKRENKKKKEIKKEMILEKKKQRHSQGQQQK